ncbi:aminotransferase class V-fold PLP-dependent enzyme [candidate division KSB1 bacterium]|nr:aminotransferase class V-fold PLP-dependent enzyme [candidate division KSB1 bacterium]
MIYFDNAATSFPKPQNVADAMLRYMNEIGANPGRSGHRLAIAAGRSLYSAREAVADLFHATDPLRVVFGHNITTALNIALRGILRPGNHVITSSLEHNAMMRPLRMLQQKGIELTVVPCTSEGVLDPRQIELAIRPHTTMIALNHASNIIGTLLPIHEVGRIARQNQLLFLVDTAQSAGAIPIDMQQAEIDLLAFTGHKALYGPMGTGGLVFGDRIPLDRFEPIITGGTGSKSESESQPDFLPDLCESGTPNAVGLAGLEAGIRWLSEVGIEAVRAHEIALTSALIERLGNIPGVQLYGTRDANKQLATVSFNIEGMQPSEVGLRLDEEFDILCRVGLHCTPASHKTIGTFPRGTVRFGLGYFNTPEEVDAAANAVKILAGETK